MRGRRGFRLQAEGCARMLCSLRVCVVAIATLHGRRAAGSRPGRCDSPTSPNRPACVTRASTAASTAKRFILETNGCGTGLLDYDRDGWLDALVLSGTQARSVEPPRGVVGRSGSAAQPPVSQQARRHVRGRHRARRPRSRRLGLERVRGRLRQRRLARSLRHLLRAQRALPQRRGCAVRRRDPRGRAARRPEARWGSGCSFLDYDRDGDLDLFVANYLRFDIATAAEPGQGANCVWKGVPVNCGPKGLPPDTNLFYRNNGNGTFSDVSAASRHRAASPDATR